MNRLKASSPPAEAPVAAAPSLFEDAAFAAPAVPPAPEAVFALSPAMRHYLEHDIAPLLQQQGPKTVILTLGSRGALVVEGTNTPEFVAAEKVKAVDTTGAGDSFVGSFAYFLASGRPMVDAARRATRVATRSVLKPGTQMSFPWRDEVLEILAD